MSKSNCKYCGNNPVPHYFYWHNESLNILFTSIRQKILYNLVTYFLVKNNFGKTVGFFLIRSGMFLRVVKLQSNIANCKVRRAQVLWEEVLKRGGKMQEVLLFGKPLDLYIIEKSENTKILFSGLPRPKGYINKWLDLMDDKWLFKKLMLENNLPVALGASCSNFSQAKKFFEKIQNTYNLNLLSNKTTYYTNVIVKPRSGSRGRHSTTFVKSLQELKKAFNIAKQLCYWVMVEEQLFGPVYRATVINFELAGVLKGEAPKVVGDGKSTIAELVNNKNGFKPKSVKNIIVDSSVESFLERQNLSINSVLEINNEVYLTEKIGINYGGSSSEDYDICHMDNKELFVIAAKLLGDPIVGFDFIIPDITKSYKEQKCGFLEVNSLPFINLHHDPLFGTPRNVAGKVLDLIKF